MFISTADRETSAELKLGDNVIAIGLASDVQDLRILVDNRLTFAEHINHSRNSVCQSKS